jgi:hypothetical protein
MQIFHEAGATSTEHDGVTYEADENGILDVPQDVGELFVRRPGWHEVGWTPELTPEELVAAEVAEKDELRHRIAVLEGEVAELKGKVGNTAKRAPAATKK